MEDFIAAILSAAGGVVLGPILTRLAGASATGGLLGGIIGGLAAHYGLDAANIQVLGDGADSVLAPINVINNLLEGALGGGILGLLGGVLMRPKR
ncbi:hypothetical protein HY29_12990 [Hyphomonas beringensis]|uniref:Uncharacterized protein n=1 Tax=Hyphomonas beringensis TaxID=1280946 RepID=A0A062UFE4_9PROT|nr:hypothetical protein [Hyphomonas beringensis]KCZ54835.1 hypothetical protein HY29_12990 [Hyphomonas beringensis]